MGEQVPAPTSTLAINGKEAYSCQKYELAARLFSTALESISLDAKCDRLRILDLRIATYVKLKDNRLALADAKEMIRITRHDSRGYLRCGQLERLGGNYDAAVKWYRHGLKNVPRTDPMFVCIESQLLRINQLSASKIVLSKQTDPMLVLPIEIVRMVLSYLTYKQHINLLFVSRHWKRLCTSLPPVSDTIDFRGTVRQISHTMLTASFKRLCRQPKNIFLTDLSTSAANSVWHHLGKWIFFQTLEHLEVNDGKLHLSGLRFDKFNLKTIVIGQKAPVTLSQVHTILNMCKSLSIAQFCNTTNDSMYTWTNDISHQALKTLEISTESPNLLSFPIVDAIANANAPSRMADQESDVHPPQLFGQFPLLECFVCRGAEIAVSTMDTQPELDFSTQKTLRHIDLSSSMLSGSLKLPPKLETLRLAKTCLNWRTRNPHSSANQPVLSSVTMLDFYDCRPDLELSQLMKGSHGHGVLKDLSINLDAGYIASLFIEMVLHHGWLAELRTLRIKFQNLEDSHSQLFMQGIPKLQKLCIENAKISGIFLIELLKSPCAELQEIVLRNCTRVSLDSIEWARNLGVQVEIRAVPNTNLGGRAIRVAV